MPVEWQEILTGIACFLCGGVLGYAIRLQRYEDEVRDWKAIARKAQMLNRLADALKEEREWTNHDGN
jgi:hypothetical protein